MLKKQKYPILEFDADRGAIISPETSYVKIKGFPEHGIICFLGEAIAKLKAAGRLKLIHTVKSVCTPYPVYQVTFKGKKVLLFNPYIGAAAAGGIMEEVSACGCNKWISCGSAGVLDRKISVGHLIIAGSAVRDEGFSYHYLKPSREVSASPRAVKALKTTLDRHGVPYRVSKAWTTDAFFRETPAKIALRRKEGCLVVDMETAAILAVAKFRGYHAGTLLYGCDDVSGKDWDRRRAHDRSYIQEKILWLAVEACLAI
jgi:uridine phosphorylase